ncbi:MAG: TldD/PmbA family protein [Candidatus Diapherotrites archaeon]
MNDFVLSVDNISDFKEDFQKHLSFFAEKNNVPYFDARLSISNFLGAEALNGNSKSAVQDYFADVGVRVFYGKSFGMGFAGTTLSKSDFSNFKLVCEALFGKALGLAKANSFEKERFLGVNSVFSESFSRLKQKKVEWKRAFKKSPLDANCEDFVKDSERISSELKKIEGVASNVVSIFACLERKVFVNSLGSIVDQTLPITEPSVFVAAKGKSLESYHEWLSDSKGLEALDGNNSHSMSFDDFCVFVAKGVVDLSNAPAVPNVQNAVVVSDPWFNTLLCHEICGHPSEADRALKRETAWAGRAWWFRNFDDNEIEKRVGSEEMSVVSDPTLEGYGNYLYDDEGILASKVVNVEKGILKGFMNSNETSFLLGEKPNGHMRASSSSMVPLVRMSNTFFDKGSWKANELIEETRNGFYVSGQKIPSIGESRQNFNISCWKIFEIKNGEITRLYRKGSVEGNSFDVFMTIEAADDLKLYNVPNCGKGTPMQTMRVGNGGPHLRFRANVGSFSDDIHSDHKC